METSRSQNFYQDLKSRELNGFRVRKRSYTADVSSDFSEIGAIAIEHSGEQTPPLATSFCKTSKYSHILAVSDEDGYVSLYNTRLNFPLSASFQENSEKARVSNWVAHHNSVFDICWIKEDTHILTASGDQTIKLWDAQEKKCVGVFMGHTGSVKSLSSHPTNDDIVVSGSRDGSFSLWDLRCKTSSKTRRGDVCISSTAVVKGAHLSPQAKRVRRGKAASVSIPSVLYLKDEISIATAGAVDSVVKFWDTRNLKAQVTQTCPHHKSSTTKETRSHGISSLSQDRNGVFLSASCMDNRIYLYNVLQLEKGPMQTFSGCRTETFFVKSQLSHDAAHILSGSSDGNAYLWQVKKPQKDPIKLKGHDGEVTAVDWCTSEAGKIATCSDDFSVRIWNIQNSCRSSTSLSSPPSCVRRRVMAMSNVECKRRLLGDEETMDITKHPDKSTPSNEENSPYKTITMPKMTTPESNKKLFSSADLEEEITVRTPEATLESPSSVLNPPSTLKRKTIKDYFLAAS